MCEKCNLSKEDKKFLAERERILTLSGARVERMNKEKEELEKEIKETTKNLRFLL